MSRVSELIDLIVQGKNAEASDVLNQELLSRSYEGINELKPEVAMDYFAPVVNMPDDGGPITHETDEVYDETDS